MSTDARARDRTRTVDGHHARRRFGQNFLVDRTVIDSIVRCIAPVRDDCIVEIGPGLGALTDALLLQLDHLTVVEIDRDLASRLRERYEPERLAIHQADVLQLDWPAFHAADSLRVVGNLPYNISSPLLVLLIEHRAHVRDQHFMLQREVVDRIVAGPGPDNGRLGVLLQAFYDCERVLDVPPEAFRPAPRVHSAVVRMRTRAEARVPDARMLGEVLAIGFSQRRKMIRSTLLPWLAARGITLPGVDERERPERIPADVWYDVATQLHAQRQTDALTIQPTDRTNP